MSSIRALFPYFNISNEVYLDTAATSQRLAASLSAMSAYYETFNANVHRGNYSSAVKASNQYENARQTVCQFVGAQNAADIIFTSGSTDALNIVANGLHIDDLQGNTILVCESEHHANLLPWQAFAATHNLKFQRIFLGENGVFTDLELTNALDEITDDIAILAIAHVSNALGNIYPIKELCHKASQVNALTVVDGTQAGAHIHIDVTDINCDFYCLSGHKMYAGTGIGVLYGKQAWLEKLKTSKLGGEMITQVTWDNYEVQAAPMKFEAGTPNIAGALGLASAINFIVKNHQQIQEIESNLLKYLVSHLMPLVNANKLILLGNINIDLQHTIALVSFYLPDTHANDIAAFFATQHIAVRAGHHCAMPLMQSLNIDGCVRVSIACYTTKEEIDYFLSVLHNFLEIDFNQNHSSNAIKRNGTIQPLGIESSLKEASDWNSKHRLLLLHSKQLNKLPENELLSEYQVIGCEAEVWLALKAEKLSAYSNSKVIRGILAVLIDKINSLPMKEVSSFDITAYFEALGLSHYFSQGRRDGIQQIIKRVQSLYQGN
jgi:cysteine desulfurase/selenocysteine lyase